MKNTYLFLALALTLSIFSGCTEETSKPEDDNTSALECRITEELFKSGSYTSTIKATYNSAKQVTKLTAFDDGVEFGVVEFTRNSAGRVEQALLTTEEDGDTYTSTMTITYNSDGQITKTKLVGSDGEEEVQDFHYASGVIDYEIYTYSEPGEDIERDSTKYIVANGLIMQSRTLHEDGFFNNTVYTYDDKNAIPRFLINEFDIQLSMAHNTVKEVQSSGNLSDPDNVNTYTSEFTYTYNDHNYPTKRVHTSNSDSYEDQYTYECD